MSPTQLLQQELDVWKRALSSSKQQFADGKIDLKLHETHVKNLEPKIEAYIKALRILRLYTNEES